MKNFNLTNKPLLAGNLDLSIVRPALDNDGLFIQFVGPKNCSGQNQFWKPLVLESMGLRGKKYKVRH